ncbi:MAG TPA: DNA-formamidopyrimidine glycosylase family protein [Gammaproteobacteria bacterium]|nr:DNA-formamidopyrimidine glycosylase family protein [Gammaproteobacteria bacterium]
MPELPDVEVFRRYMDATALHQTVAEVVTADARVVQGATPADLATFLRGRRFERTERHGKHLFAAVDGDGWLELHFGMTGFLRYYQGADAAPAHGHVRFRFDNGYELAFVDRRKLGHVAPVADLAAYMAELELGVDALDPGLDAAAFRELANGRRGQVKCWLMDQATLAGLGNVYSDEVLFQAGIHPRQRLERLEVRELDAIHAALGDVLQAAIAARVEPAELPAGFLLPLRDAEGAHCPRCGSELATVKACGRTAHYCPRCQAAPD